MALPLLEASLGTSIVWGNLTLPCVAGSEMEGQTLGAGGYFADRAAQIVIRRTTLGTNWPGPTKGQRIRLVRFPGDAGIDLRVVHVETPPAGGFISLRAESADRGV